jgi:hypothetical protein
MKLKRYLILLLSILFLFTGCGTLKFVEKKERPPDPATFMLSDWALDEYLDVGGNKVRAFTSLIGGGSGALDKVNSSNITDGDTALVITATYKYTYSYDDSSAAGEDSPSVIMPDNAPGTGRWILSKIVVMGLVIGDADISEVEAEILDGATVTTIELNYSVGLSELIQTSLDAKEPTITEGSIGNGFVVLDDLKAEAKWVRETITTDADPYEVTPTAGWNVYNEYYLLITPHQADVNLELQVTGPPANQCKAHFKNEGAEAFYIADINAQQEVINDGTLTVAAGEWAHFIWDTDRWTQDDDRVNQSFKTFLTTEIDFIPVGYKIDGASAAAALATITSGTDKVNVRNFDGAADEDLVFDWSVPEDIVVATGAKYRVICFIVSATGPSNEKWSFQLAGFSMGDGDPLNGTLGTAVASSIAGRTDAQYDRVATAWSSAMTTTHITDLLGSETVEFKLNRDADGANDDYVQDIGVLGIEVKYTRTHDTTF